MRDSKVQQLQVQACIHFERGGILDNLMLWLDYFGASGQVTEVTSHTGHHRIVAGTETYHLLAAEVPWVDWLGYLLDWKSNHSLAIKLSCVILVDLGWKP